MPKPKLSHYFSCKKSESREISMAYKMHVSHAELKQMYRTRFIYYCMTSRGDNENCTVLFFCCNCIMMQPDEQPDRHMHLTYPWPPVI
ncbi:hypothetical protein T03_16581 [Trichinella britovi]|uniref:Uncharacterized protein n=1 Tax=Trichinella britovi TaxID=45882 RepID=A0A0V1CCB4_TRIBR|nr:hypothetical protein T03_16581 [Trichinella britovi]